jgi:hypothetical protein
MANPIVQQINAELESLQKELDKFKSNVEYLNGAKVLVKGAIQGLNSAEGNFNEKIIELKSTYASFIKLTDAVIAVIAKIDTVNFPERLNSIEETVKGIITNLEETKKATLEELQKASQIITNADFEGKFKNLEALINKSVESSDKLTQYISKLKLAEKFEKFEKSINENLEKSFTKVETNTNKIAKEAAKSILDLNLPVRIDKLDANIAGILTSIQNVQSRIESVERNIGEKLKESSDKQASSLTSFQEKMAQSIEAMARKQRINTYITWFLILASLTTIILLIKL